MKANLKINQAKESSPVPNEIVDRIIAPTRPRHAKTTLKNIPASLKKNQKIKNKNVKIPKDLKKLKLSIFPSTYNVKTKIS